ncbi:MAG TPA: wax ester/triacylglycerol synthase family O-acyltransferase [Acidimicrobiales bacterium]|nr:wax ester/triacylglycerol synthase family O-acyltransferase [Acidimicrobiales bacterium]
MDHLSTLDAEFLHVEDGIAHMHIAGGCVFTGPPPTLDELSALVRGKMHQIPRYRQRVRSVPLELGRPIWADDPEFDLRYHLRRTALPSPGDDAAFCALMGRLMSQPLDRDRPLWETWLVEGVEGGNWALIFKVHHCLVDGVAGAGLLPVLLDLEPTTDVPEPLPWAPTPEPNGAAKVVDAWAGLARDAAASARGLPGAIRDPRGAARSAVSTAQGLVRWAANLGTTSPLSVDGTIGRHRSWAHANVPLADVKAVGKAFGAKVNDVVVAAVTGGYRDLLTERGDDVEHAVLRSLVPVSTRRDDGQGVLDNRVSAMLYELPVSVADPVERLRMVEEQLTELKGSRMAEAGAVLTEIGDLAPPPAIGTVTRMVVRAMRRLPQRSINTVTTNVPGPQFPLYCLGREMVEYRPFVPIYHGVRVGTAILSYNGTVYFGVTGDFATTPNVRVVADGAVRAVRELHDRVTGTGRTGRKRRTRSTDPAP